jgi:tetratricopeptide (TPR) repeat protein
VTDDLYARYHEALRRGHQQASETKFKDALASYQVAAGLAGERALPHICVGGMQLRLGRRKEALAAYERALELEPSNLDALGGRAAALLAAGRRADAEAVRAQIAALRGETPSTAGSPSAEAVPVSGAEAHAIVGEQARAAGNSEAAIDAWLAESADHIADEHFDAALDACLRALSLDSGSARVHVELLRTYFMRGWHEQAVERAILLDRLMTLEPNQAVEKELHELTVQYGSGDPRVRDLIARGMPSPVES